MLDQLALSDELETDEMFESFAQSLIAGNSGETISIIMNAHCAYLIHYEGDSIWSVDGQYYDSDELIPALESMLRDLDPPVLVQLLSDYLE